MHRSNSRIYSSSCCFNSAFVSVSDRLSFTIIPTSFDFGVFFSGITGFFRSCLTNSCSFRRLSCKAEFSSSSCSTCFCVSVYTLVSCLSLCSNRSTRAIIWCSLTTVVKSKRIESDYRFHSFYFLITAPNSCSKAVINRCIVLSMVTSVRV